MTATDADVVVVGAGFAGLLVARELVAEGRSVTVLERGTRLSHRQQIENRAHEVVVPTTRHNDEAAEGTDYAWLYTYGVGGSSLHWTGVAPRLMPSDFELRSRHGVGRDWPVSYSELEPFFEEAEQTLSVAGGPNPVFGRAYSPPLPPHPLSPVDEAVALALEPFYTLPQARTSRRVGGRAACCGATTCELCPVDARFSMLHVLDDGLGASDRLELRELTAVARLRREGSRTAAVETIDGEGRRGALQAETVVLAANGLENPGILLRSGLDGPDVGRWLFDHSHRLLDFQLDRRVPHGHGAALITGVSYAYAEGQWRSERGGQLVLPFNPGLSFNHDIAEAIVAGRDGAELRDDIRERYSRTLVLDTVGEDLPRRERRVELSPRKDDLGLPLNRVSYPQDTGYIALGRRAMYADLERRLRPFGARLVRARRMGEGAHTLGTCFMGEGSGVVDRDQRHHEIENLYVTGGSAFPSYSSHHPTVTICALAIRLGRMLAGRSMPAR